MTYTRCCKLLLPAFLVIRLKKPGGTKKEILIWPLEVQYLHLRRIYILPRTKSNQPVSIYPYNKEEHPHYHTLEAFVKGQKEPEQRLSKQRAIKQRKKPYKSPFLSSSPF